jgi:hypothetical protein
MRRALPVLSVIPLLLAYGVAEGLWTDRWGPSAELAQAAERLARLPDRVGPWAGQDEELNPRQVRLAELSGHLLRHYTHPGSGERLTVLAVCGRAGPVAVHSPEVCYGGAGFHPSRQRVRHRVEAEGLPTPPEFWSERYQKEAGVPEFLQIHYAWHGGAGWSAADNPRLAFARARAVSKLYVVRRLARPDEPAEDDPIPDFLRLFIPQLDRCLFGEP